MGYNFPKRVRIYLRDEIRTLFSSKESFTSYPFRVLYKVIPSDADSSIKVLISVPKKRFKRAVDRNLLKRRFRESYRLQVGDYDRELLEKVPNGSQLLLGFIYIANEVMDYAAIEKGVDKAFQKLLERGNRE